MYVDRKRTYLADIFHLQISSKSLTFSYAYMKTPTRPNLTGVLDEAVHNGLIIGKHLGFKCEVLIQQEPMAVAQ